MKKLKLFLPVLAVFMVFVLCFSVACNPDTDKDKDDDTDIGDDVEQVEPASDEWTLESITLGGDVKTEYALNYGGDIDATNLTVTAKLVHVEDGTDKTEDVTSSAVIDGSEFNPNVVGEYDIFVSYTREKVTRSASYTVSVKGASVAVGGLEIVKTKTVYDVEGEPYTVDINLDDITVYDVGDDGERGDALTPETDYSLKYYKGAEKQENLSAATAGVYTVVAEKNSDKSTSFVKVIVRDPAEKLEHVSKGAVLTQKQSLTDEISADWTYRLTRKSGAVESLTASDVNLGKVSTLIPSEYTVTATYTEVAYGDDGVAKVISSSTDISYTVTKNEEFTLRQYAANFESFDPEVIADGSDLIDYKYDNAPITLMPGTNKSEIVKNTSGSWSYLNENEGVNKKFTKRLKFNGASSASNLRYIKVELEGPSLLTVVAASGSSSTERGVILYGSDKNGNVNNESVLSKQGVKAVTKLDFIVEEAGTYYIGVDASILFYYVQIDTFLTDADAEELLLPTATVDSISASREEGAVEYYAIGSTTVDSTNIKVTKSSVNPATCDCTETDISGDASLTYAFTDPLTAEMIGTEQTVTVTYGTTTATYKIKVTTADRIYSVTEPSLKASYTLPTASATTAEIDFTEVYTLKTVTADGEGTVTATEVKVTDAQNAEQTITENKVNLAKGEYTVTIKYVTADKTWTFTKSITVGDYVAPTEGTEEYGVLYKFDGAGTTGEATWNDNKADIAVDENVAITITTDTSKVESKTYGDITFVGYSAIKTTSKYITVKLSSSVNSAKMTIYFRNSSGGKDNRTLSVNNGTEDIATWNVGLNGINAEGTAVTALANVELNSNVLYTLIGSDNLYVYGIYISYEVNTGSTPTIPDPIELSADDLEAKELGIGETMAWGSIAELIEGTADKKVKVQNANGKQLVGAKADVKTTGRINIGGGIQNEGGQSVKLTLTSPCTVTVYVANSGDDARTLNLYDNAKTAVVGSEAQSLGAKNTVVELTFTVTQEMITAQNGTFYLGGSGAFYLYYLTVTYTA